MTTKTENYTAEMTTDLVEAYTKAETSEARLAVVAFYAEKLGKTVNSVRAKLTREKVYIAKVYTNKKGEKPVKKDAIVTAIAGKIGMTVEACDSLEKVNKNVLVAIVKALG
jgi:hypothetical protein